jgi:DNA-3-methyladenine glycosylase II
MGTRRLTRPALARAAAHLSGIAPDWARLVGEVGPCTLRPQPRREPYEALVRAVAYQQLHARAADAILGRLLARFPGDDFPSPERLRRIRVATLRTCGFSEAKAESIRAIATAAAAGVVPSRVEAEALDDEELVRRLTTLRGVGRWTVEMLLIFTLQRPDVLPADDFGVRDGWRRFASLPAMPTPRAMREIGAAWSPYRSVASWYLWRVPR